jgi:hypothetical protein
MVFMTVRQHYAFEFVRVFAQIRKIGQDEINARHLLVRERHTGVHKHHAAPLAHGCHVLADLPKSSEGYDLQGSVV